MDKITLTRITLGLEKKSCKNCRWSKPQICSEPRWVHEMEVGRFLPTCWPYDEMSPWGEIEPWGAWEPLIPRRKAGRRPRSKSR